MKPKIVYLAGKIIGLPYWYVVIKFKLYELFLVMMGYDVLNPVAIIPKETPYNDAMETCLKMVRTCEAIYMQFDWRWSKGAKKELYEAAINSKILLNPNNRKRKYYNNFRNAKILSDFIMKGYQKVDKISK